MKKRIILAVYLLISVMQSVAQPDWGLGIFVKPAENPVAGPDSTFLFFCPEKKMIVQWQKADVFNPAAIVRGGKVYLFPRCEDNPKAMIGGRTSRIGIAVSEDGIHFKKFPKPVLYPGNDSLNLYDTMGGCEDPRIAESAGRTEPSGWAAGWFRSGQTAQRFRCAPAKQ